jgi:hypothetical protein
MRTKMFPLLTFVALFGAILISNSCGSSKNCPVCGTDKNGTIGLIDVMIVPEHNPNGEPGGPFNIFDISWVDPTNRLYSVSDRPRRAGVQHHFEHRAVGYRGAELSIRGRQ